MKRLFVSIVIPFFFSCSSIQLITQRQIFDASMVSFGDVSRLYKAQIYGRVTDEISAIVEKHGSCQELSRYIEKANELFCLIGGYEQLLLLDSRILPISRDQEALWLSMVYELTGRIIYDWEIVFRNQDPPRSIVEVRELIERYAAENRNETSSLILNRQINFICDERIRIIPRINCE